MKRCALFFGCLLLLIFVGGSLFTPWTWQWNASNLQVRMHNIGNERRHQGSYGESAYWSKLSFFTADWWRDFGTDQVSYGRDVMTSASEMRLAGAAPNGVWVHVRYQEVANERTTAFDKSIFIPAHGEAHVDISPDIYITGSFD